jgi:hypothetical protein
MQSQRNALQCPKRHKLRTRLRETTCQRKHAEQHDTEQFDRARADNVGD